MPTLLLNAARANGTLRDPYAVIQEMTITEISFHTMLFNGEIILQRFLKSNTHLNVAEKNKIYLWIENLKAMQQQSIAMQQLFNELNRTIQSDTITTDEALQLALRALEEKFKLLLDSYLDCASFFIDNQFDMLAYHAFVNENKIKKALKHGQYEAVFTDASLQVDGQMLLACLITPVQRIPRIKNLFEELNKQTDKALIRLESQQWLQAQLDVMPYRQRGQALAQKKEELETALEDGRKAKQSVPLFHGFHQATKDACAEINTRRLDAEKPFYQYHLRTDLDLKEYGEQGSKAFIEAKERCREIIHRLCHCHTDKGRYSIFELKLTDSGVFAIKVASDGKSAMTTKAEFKAEFTHLLTKLQSLGVDISSFGDLYAGSAWHKGIESRGVYKAYLADIDNKPSPFIPDLNKAYGIEAVESAFQAEFETAFATALTKALKSELAKVKSADGFNSDLFDEAAFTKSFSSKFKETFANDFRKAFMAKLSQTRAYKDKAKAFLKQHTLEVLGQAFSDVQSHVSDITLSEETALKRVIREIDHRQGLGDIEQPLRNVARQLEEALICRQDYLNDIERIKAIEVEIDILSQGASMQVRYQKQKEELERIRLEYEHLVQSHPQTAPDLPEVDTAFVEQVVSEDSVMQQLPETYKQCLSKKITPALLGHCKAYIVSAINAILNPIARSIMKDFDLQKAEAIEAAKEKAQRAGLTFVESDFLKDFDTEENRLTLKERFIEATTELCADDKLLYRHLRFLQIMLNGERELSEDEIIPRLLVCDKADAPNCISQLHEKFQATKSKMLLLQSQHQTIKKNDEALRKKLQSARSQLALTKRAARGHQQTQMLELAREQLKAVLQETDPFYSELSAKEVDSLEFAQVMSRLTEELGNLRHDLSQSENVLSQHRALLPLLKEAALQNTMLLDPFSDKEADIEAFDLEAACHYVATTLTELSKAHDTMTSEIEALKLELDKARGEEMQAAVAAEREALSQSHQKEVEAIRLRCKALEKELQSLREKPDVRHQGVGTDSELDSHEQALQELRLELETLRQSRQSDITLALDKQSAHIKALEQELATLKDKSSSRTFVMPPSLSEQGLSHAPASASGILISKEEHDELLILRAENQRLRVENEQLKGQYETPARIRNLLSCIEAIREDVLSRAKKSDLKIIEINKLHKDLTASITPVKPKKLTKEEVKLIAQKFCMLSCAYRHWNYIGFFVDASFAETDSAETLFKMICSGTDHANTLKDMLGLEAVDENGVKDHMLQLKNQFERSNKGIHFDRVDTINRCIRDIAAPAA